MDRLRKLSAGAVAFKIGIQKSPSKIYSSPGHQIHNEKRGIAHHIDPPKSFAEFNAVKRSGGILDEHDVREMKISMTFANEPLSFPIGKRFEEFGMLLVHPLLE